MLAHRLRGHTHTPAPFMSWCSHCGKSRGITHHHRRTWHQISSKGFLHNFTHFRNMKPTNEEDSINDWEKGPYGPILFATPFRNSHGVIALPVGSVRGLLAVSVFAETVAASSIWRPVRQRRSRASLGSNVGKNPCHKPAMTGKSFYHRW